MDRPGVRLGAPDQPAVASPRSPLFWVEAEVAPEAPGTCGPGSWCRGWDLRSVDWGCELSAGAQTQGWGPRSRAPGSVLTMSTRRVQPASGGQPAPASLVRSDIVPGRAHRPQPRPQSQSPASPSSVAATPGPPCL